MEREVAWNKYSESDLLALEDLAAGYIDFISDNKTERECSKAARDKAERNGYGSLAEAVESKRKLVPGDRVWVQTQGKTLMLVHLGSEPLEKGFNILGAHVDSPRLDIKQNPLYESNGLALLDTHYYGGIKNYQWVTLPLALHGVVVRSDGSVIDVNIGEDPEDPVFVITDLLPHLAAQQLDKKANKVVEGEELDLLVGNKPKLVDEATDVDDESGETASATADSDAETSSEDARSSKPADKEPVKALICDILKEKYGFEEEDFLSAELEVVPAGRARELGLDRSMVLGYGQDDRVCAYTSLEAQLELARTDEIPVRTAITLLVDKEEIGSVGATGMTSNFFENAVAEIMELAGEGGDLPLRRALANSRMLSSDVSAGYDPTYASAFEPKNAAYLGKGLVFNKYTGARGKSGSNDASAEYVAQIRKIMDDADVSFQTAELGKIDVGGGGTIAYIPAKYGMDVIDSGVAVLSMHSPWEATSKADIYEAKKGYVAFLKNA